MGEEPQVPGPRRYDMPDAMTAAVFGTSPREIGLRTLRSEEHTSELQSRSNLVCRLLLEKKHSPMTIAPATIATDLASARVPHLVTELPGPKAQAAISRDRAIVSSSLGRVYPLGHDPSCG